MPVLLFDFVESAHEVYWYQTTSNSDGEFTQDLPFFFEPVVPDVESYLPESDSAYVGWSFDTQLTNGNRYEKVLLTYPLYEHFKVFGDYTVKIGRPAPEAYLELTAGFKDIVIEPVEGVMFRVYVNGKVYIEEPYYFGSEPIQTGSRIRLAANTYEFRLEVESLDPSPYDFATWAVVRLWDKEP